jgi:hypothetical protein
MRLSLKLAASLGILALLVTVWIKYRNSNGNAPSSPSASSDQAAMSERVQRLRHSQRPQLTEIDSSLGEPRPATNTTNATVAPGQVAESDDWEEKIDDILGVESDTDLQKSRKLLALMPKLPAEGQLEAITHAANLVDDEHYAPLGQLVTNPLTSEAVLDVLMSDLANRTNTVKLSTYLQVARQPKHPMAEEARTLLELYLDEDYGNDWIAWDKAIQEWLRAEQESVAPPEKNF